MMDRETLTIFLVVLTFLSFLLPLIPWSVSILGAFKRKRIDDREIKLAALRVGIGALCSGLVIALFAWVVPAKPRENVQIVEYLFAFVGCPFAWAIFCLIGLMQTVRRFRLWLKDENSTGERNKE
jgi:hypothetical protein